MKILIESGTYDMLNLGDVAMLQVGLKRLRAMWPQAELRLITLTPELLPQYCPEAIPVGPTFFAGRKQWLEQFNLLGPFRRLAPIISSKSPILLECELRTRFPNWAYHRITHRMRKRGADTTSIDYFFQQVSEADAMVVTGGGFMTDAFLDYNTWLAETAAVVAGLGKPLAFFGQGLGPLENPHLRKRSAEAYSNAAIIGIREPNTTRGFLNDAGVDEANTQLTGDDAIELAYNERKSTLGNAIGLNLRTTDYSSIGSEHTQRLRRVVNQFALEIGADLVPLIISRYEGTDIDTMSELFPERPTVRDEALAQDMPIKVIEQVARCRIVVTGSYHAGVFALSQGIPMIGLARSQYYRGKFTGLSDQFGAGAEVVLFDDPAFEDTMLMTLRRVWRDAEETRGPLLEAARRQLEMSTAAYERFRSVVTQGTLRS